MIYTVLLYVCFSANPCTPEKARFSYEGFFTNSSVNSKTPCKDWLIVQLEYNTSIGHNHDELTIHYECRREPLFKGLQ